VIIPYQHFGTTYRFDLQRSSNPRRKQSYFSNWAPTSFWRCWLYVVTYASYIHISDKLSNNSITKLLKDTVSTTRYLPKVLIREHRRTTGNPDYRACPRVTTQLQLITCYWQYYYITYLSPYLQDIIKNFGTPNRLKQNASCIYRVKRKRTQVRLKRPGMAPYDISYEIQGHKCSFAMCILHSYVCQCNYNRAISHCPT
jgi:hypothetical protein